MLKKLLKYDLKNIYKFLIVFYGLALFFAILTRIFLSFENSLILNIIGEICSGTTISMMISVLINNTMRLWVRFRQNLYGDESYLTHTLPVKKKELYFSKFATAFLTIITSMAVVVASILIAYANEKTIESVKGMINGLSDMYNINSFTILSALFIILYVEFLSILQCGYAGIILGHRRNGSKIGFSVIYGFVAYILSQIIMVIVIFSVALFDKDFMNLFVTVDAVNVNTLKTVAVMAIIGYSAVCAMLYFINQKLLSKGVNVD